MNTTPNQNGSTKLVHEAKYLRLVKSHGWEFVQRVGSTGVVTILAKTVDDHVIFVEQFRIPVGANVIEFPAGLAGDLLDAKNESLTDAASRELVEETGYQATKWTHLLTCPSSAGLTDEMISFFLAEDVVRVGPGGGDESETILVHEIPMAELDDWLRMKQRSGVLLDARLYTGLHLLNRDSV